MTNLDSVLKSKDITLLAKVHIVKAVVFPMVMNSCESWTVKKAEHQRTDAFKLWCWRRLLKVPWTARRSNQSILREINPEYSLEGLMLKLKLQDFGHLMLTDDSLDKSLMLILPLIFPSIRGWDGWTASLMQWTWTWENSWRWWRTGRPCYSPRSRKESDTTGWLNNNNKTIRIHVINIYLISVLALGLVFNSKIPWSSQAPPIFLHCHSHCIGKISPQSLPLLLPQ